MSKVKLNTDGIRYLALFEQTTGVSPIDCIIDNELNKITFIVKSVDMGGAIGKNGEHVNKVRSVINKQIAIVEYSDNAVEFIKNVLQPVSIRDINIVNRNDKRIAYLEVNAREKGLAIGRGGRNIDKIKMIVKRHHDINDVIIQ